MALGARLRARAEALPAPYPTITLAVGALLWLLHAALRALLGAPASGPAPDALLPLAHPSFRVAVLLRARGRARDRAALAPLLPEPPRAEVSAERPLPPRGHTLAVGAFAAAGIAVVLGTSDEARRMLGGAAPGFALLWGFAQNALLFGLMGHLAYDARVVERRFREAVTERIRVDLLDPGPLAVFARRGLRNAAYWMIGSAIASLLFLSFGFAWAHALVIVATLGVGTTVLLEPVVGIHRRLVRERAAELARVRRALAREREAALREGGSGDAAAARLPGLLALEARLERADTWPFDASTGLRFAALGALAVGSWLGGALVERLVGLAIA